MIAGRNSFPGVITPGYVVDPLQGSGGCLTSDRAGVSCEFGKIVSFGNSVILSIGFGSFRIRRFNALDRINMIHKILKTGSPHPVNLINPVKQRFRAFM